MKSSCQPGISSSSYFHVPTTSTIENKTSFILISAQSNECTLLTLRYFISRPIQHPIIPLLYISIKPIFSLFNKQDISLELLLFYVRLVLFLYLVMVIRLAAADLFLEVEKAGEREVIAGFTYFIKP